MRGILSYGTYLPFWRLDRATIAAVAGTGGGKGTRTVASYDEDTTTMGVEAARRALRGYGGELRSLWFSTTAPAYVDRTNATAIHAVLRLDRSVAAVDANGAIRSGVALLRDLAGPALIVSADIRTGLPGGPEESAGGDGAAAVIVGSDADGPLLAEYLGGASATEEFLDRWRVPGQVGSKLWEERFGEGRYTALGSDAWALALKDTGVDGGAVDHLAIVGTHARAAAGLAKQLDAPNATLADGLAAKVGHTGAAHPALVLASALDAASPGQVVALVSLADGADVLLFRKTAAPVASDEGRSGLLPYGKFLAWRGMLPIEPPRRPEPARVSASAAGRSESWKFGFVGSRDVATGEVRMPPAVAGADPAAQLEPVAVADSAGTVVTSTVDRLAYSPSPPVVFAVVDFDAGGRLPVEVTDVGPDGVRIGDRVEPTFRRLSTADGIHNYFWKVRPLG
jgi:hydroxymethylglutaryl-CoA synthase